jgi:hypothetical protein
MKISLSKRDVVQASSGVVGTLNTNTQFTGEFVYQLSRNKRYLEPEAKSVREGEDANLKAFREKCKELGCDSGRPKDLYDSIVEEFKDDIAINEKYIEEKVEIEIYPISVEVFNKEKGIPSLFGEWMFPLIIEKSDKKTS